MDIKEPSRVLLQGNGTFNLEEEVGRGGSQDGRWSWFLGALCPLAAMYPLDRICLF